MLTKKKIIFSFILPISVTILIPLILLYFIENRKIVDFLSENNLFLFLGSLILSGGFLLFSYCVVLFHRIGRGTLMPLKSIHTKRLIVRGPYRYIRNPMILGVLLIILGESVIFMSFPMLFWFFFFFLGNIIYIPLVEEKGMEKRFGKEFINYKQKVGAWIPKSIHPYEEPNSKEELE